MRVQIQRSLKVIPVAIRALQWRNFNIEVPLLDDFCVHLCTTQLFLGNSQAIANGTE
jgi:hypothetical protein